MNAETKVKADEKVGGPVADPNAPVAEVKAPARGRRTALMIAVPLALVLGGAYMYLTGGRYEETQDANVHQPRVAISTNISGIVTSVNFTNNQTVAKDDVLFQIDARPYTLALASANAALASARLNVEQLKAAYGGAVTQEKVAEDQVSYLETELARQVALAAKGVAATTAVDDARHAEVIAREQLETAKQNVISAAAALGGDPTIKTDTHPEVLAALAARDVAQFNLDQTTVRSPGDGIVYQAESFRPGQYVTTGASDFALVENKDVWVEADFKETQLSHVKVGQDATVIFDIYPGQTFHGKVDAIGAGTGAEFSLIPAQNATGNWVKVTQRIPVRIRLSDVDADHALHSGMSADVTVDTEQVRHLSDLLPKALVSN